MDALYIYKHSDNDDFEIRHSLRSLQRHLPYIRKIWIYGDRPSFLTDDTSLIEHVPHAVTARILPVQLPVVNFFLLMFLSSLIPDLESEYLLFCDDYYLLQDYPIEAARKTRYIEDMSQVRNPGRGLWKDALWRTYDLLIRHHYTGFNFEVHAPMYLKKQWVLDAYCDFQDFVTEDRWYGMLGPSSILNHAYKNEKMELTRVAEENSHFGFWGKPPEYENICRLSSGKTFFNFDDLAFGDGVRQFLMERFAQPSRYEKDIPAYAPSLRAGSN